MDLEESDERQLEREQEAQQPADMFTGIDEDEFHNEAAGPPDLSQEDLQIVKRDSTQEEVHRPQDMKALEKVCFDTTGGNPENVRDVSGTEADYKWLTTKFVFDWRWRKVSGTKQWVRRARLVARECRVTDGRTDCLSPATSFLILKILPVMAVNARKSLVTLDFKDAFLLVDQIELVACRFPAEFIQLMGISQEDARKFAWILWKVLPGQRNAAALWANPWQVIWLV